MFITTHRLFLILFTTGHVMREIPRVWYQSRREFKKNRLLIFCCSTKNKKKTLINSFGIRDLKHKTDKIAKASAAK